MPMMLQITLFPFQFRINRILYKKSRFFYTVFDCEKFENSNCNLYSDVNQVKCSFIYFRICIRIAKCMLQPLRAPLKPLCLSHYSHMRSEKEITTDLTAVCLYMRERKRQSFGCQTFYKFLKTR